MPQQSAKPSRHLWVGNFPEGVKKDRILSHFSKFGKIEEVHILPQKHPSQGIAAFVDFTNIHDAMDACRDRHKMEGRELRINYKFTDNRSSPDPPSPPAREAKKGRGRPRTPTHSSGAEDSSGKSSSDSSDESSSSESEGGDDSSKKKRRKKKGKEERKKTTKASSSEASSGSSGEESDGDEGQVGLLIRVSNLNSRPSDHNIEESLSSEFKKFGSPVVWVHWDKNDRYATLKFRSLEDSRKAYKVMQGYVMFGQKIKLQPADSRTTGRRGSSPRWGDEVDPNATRCLFVGNIPKGVSVYELRDTFLPFGFILDAQIKKMSGNNTYGFIHFLDLMSAVIAKRRMDGSLMRASRLKVGFGKGSPSKAVWVDGIDPNMGEVSLERVFAKHGEVTKVVVDRRKCCTVVVYDSVDTAKDAMASIKGSYIGKSRVPAVTDFASKEGMQAFSQAIETGLGAHGSFSAPMYEPMMMRGPPPMRGMHGYFPPGPGGPMMNYHNPYPGPMDSYSQPMHGGRHGFSGGWNRHGDDADDYEKELRAFARKRQQDRDRESRHSRSKLKDSRDSSESSSDESKSSQRVKRPRRKTVSESGSDVDGKEGGDLRSVLNKRNKDSKKSASAREPSLEKEGGKVAKKEEKQTKSKTSVSEEEAPSVEEERGKAKRNVRAWSPPLEEEEEGSSESEKDSSAKRKKGVKSTASGKKGREVTKPSKKEPTPPVAKGSSAPKSAPNKEEPVSIKPPKTPPPTAKKGPETPPTSDEEEQIEKQGPKTPPTPPLGMEEKAPKVRRVVQKDSPSSHSRPRQPSPPPQRRPDVGKGQEGDNIRKQDRSSPASYRRGGRRSSPQQQQQRTRSPDRRGRHSPSPVRYRSPPVPRGRSPPPPMRGQLYHRQPSPHGRYRDGRMRSPERFPGRRQSPPGRMDERRSGRVERERWRGRGRSRSPPPRDRGRSRSPPPRDRGRSRSPPLRDRGRSRSPPLRDCGRSRSPLPRDRGRSRSPPPRDRQRSRTPPHQRSSPARRRSRSPRGWGRKSPPRGRSPSPQGGRPRSPTRGHQPRSKSPDGAIKHRRGSGSGAAPPLPSRVPRTPSTTPPPPEEEQSSTGRSEPPPPLPESAGLPEPPPHQDSKQNARQPISFKIKTAPLGGPNGSGSGVLPQSPPPESSPSEPSPTEAKPVVVEAPPPPQPTQPQTPQSSESQALLNLLRRYPVVWQGHLTLKNEAAAVQLHYLTGNLELAKVSLPTPPPGQATPGLRILKRMRLEATQLEGVEKRMQHPGEHCLLLALPCGRDPKDVLAQTKALKTGFITYLLQKQAAGIIDMTVSAANYVLHIFPPCEFSEQHLSRVAPDLLSSASDSGHLMVVVAANTAQTQ